MSFMRSNAIAVLALFIALGGTAWAASKVGSGDIRNDAVKTRHIDTAQVGAPELKTDAVTRGKLAPAPRSLSVTDDSQVIGSSFTDVTFDEFRRSRDAVLEPAETLVVVNEDGLYAIDGEIHWDIDTSGDRRLRLIVTEPGGDTRLIGSDYRRAANAHTTNNVSTTEPLVEGSTIGLQASQSSSLPLPTDNFDDFAARLTVQHLGPATNIAP